MSDYNHSFKSYWGTDCALSYNKNGSALLKMGDDAQIIFNIYQNSCLCENYEEDRFYFIISTIDIDLEDLEGMQDAWFNSNVKFSLSIRKETYEKMFSIIPVQTIKDFNLYDPD